MTGPRTGPIDEAELHAWADGRLGETRRAAVAAWLKAHPEDRRRILEWKRQNELLERLGSRIAGEPIPARLTLARLLRSQWRRRALVVAVAVLLVGGLTGWSARYFAMGQGDPTDGIVGAGLLAHRIYVAEKGHAVEVSQKEPLVTWLSRRLDRPHFKAPDLQAYGLRLLGGRLLPLCDSGESAAQLMYEGAAGARYTLFTTAVHGPETPIRSVAQDDLTALSWSDHDITYVLIGAAPHARLLELVRGVQGQIEHARPE